ncbi:MAG TPA: beta-hydroxyacyl-ACP dehydratase [Kiritimatiellae bacterium]|nr:beta-hydroxyacyl-ACP dehydratase [Kiritimatiellia bacterium]
MSGLEIEEILRILPHRYPMLMVDRVVDLDTKAQKIRAIKNVSFDAGYLQGHFPGEPVLPGVLQLEAMAQTGGILLNRMYGREGQIAYFTGISRARFRRIVKPSDRMEIEVDLDRVRLGAARVRGVVKVNGEVACEADMSFHMKRG